MSHWRRRVAMGALLAAPALASAQQTGHGLAGEGGLWVEEEDGRVAVAWITSRADSGYLQVVREGRVRWEGRTPGAVAHRAVLPELGRGEYLLRYGGLTDPADRHETRVRLGARAGRARVVVRGADSIFVLGDVHGEYHRLTRLLRNAGVVDDSLRWRAGRAQLVLTGDLMDRGAEVNRTLWFVYQLERQAALQGGRVHVLLGNHEIMVFTHDLRYVAPDELRLAELHGVPYPRLYDPRRSLLGRWLASKPALLKIDRVLFAHGGLSPEYARYPLQAYDDSLAAFMGEELFRRWADTTYVPAMDSTAYARRFHFFWGDNSVFWHRGYVWTDTLGGALQRVLARHDADLLVVGHTPRPTIEPRYGGALIPVHPAQPASELLLLVRDGRRYRRMRYGLEGPPVPLADSPAAGGAAGGDASGGSGAARTPVAGA